jgi:hypothetical protein
MLFGIIYGAFLLKGVAVLFTGEMALRFVFPEREYTWASWDCQGIWGRADFACFTPNLSRLDGGSDDGTDVSKLTKGGDINVFGARSCCPCDLVNIITVGII